MTLKDLLISVLFLSTFFCTSQAQIVEIKMNEETEKYTYQKVFDVPNTSKEELHTRMNAWLALDNNLARHSKRHFDREKHTLICNGRTETRLAKIRYNLIVDFKENKYRVTFTGFISHIRNNGVSLTKTFEESKLYRKNHLKNTSKKLQLVVESMQKHMLKNSEAASDNW